MHAKRQHDNSGISIMTRVDYKKAGEEDEEEEKNPKRRFDLNSRKRIRSCKGEDSALNFILPGERNETILIFEPVYDSDEEPINDSNPGQEHSLRLLDLPVELLDEIFKYLKYDEFKVLSSVCKKLYQIVKQRKFIESTKINVDKILDVRQFNTFNTWCSPVIHAYAENITLLQRFTRLHGHLINSLDITAKTINIPDLLTILERTPNLSALSVKKLIKINSCAKIQVTENEKKELNLPHIKIYKVDDHVNINNLELHENIWKNADDILEIGITDEIYAISTLFVKTLNKNLKRLSLYGPITVWKDNAFLTELFKKCQGLQGLKIQGYANGLVLSEEIMQSNFGEKLQKLKIIGAKLTNEEMINMGKFFKNLTKLTISNCTYITEGLDIASILNEMPKLESLSINSKPLKYNIKFDIALNGNDNLKKLKLISITSADSIVSYIINFPNLETLIIKNSPQIVTTDVIHCIFRELKHLRKLILDGGTYDGKIATMPFINNSKKLEWMELLNMSITNRLLSNFKFPKLQYLHFCECPLIDVSGLKAVKKNCPLLEQLIYPSGVRENSTQGNPSNENILHLLRFL